MALPSKYTKVQFGLETRKTADHVATTVEALKQLAKDYFSSLPEDFKITYIDADGDIITMHSDKDVELWKQEFNERNQTPLFIIQDTDQATPAGPSSGYVTKGELDVKFQQITTKLDILAQAFHNKNEDEESELDDWTHVSIDVPKGWKKDLMKYYGIEPRGKEIMCMVLGEYYPKSDVTASHLAMRSGRGRTLVKLGLSTNDLHNPRNGLLLYTTIENQFDIKGLCFIYNPFKQQFLLYIVNPGIREATVVKNIKFKDIHLKPLLLLSGHQPFRRVLNTHARACFRWGRKKGWIPPDCVVFDYFDLSDGVPEYRFTNPNKVISTAINLPGTKPLIMINGQKYNVLKYDIYQVDPSWVTVLYQAGKKKQK